MPNRANKWFVTFNSHSDERGFAISRAKVLFDGESLGTPEDVVGFGIGSEREEQSKQPFKIVPSRFLARARSCQPEEPLATASGFSQWVYSLYGRGNGSEEHRRAGTVAETEIWDRRLKLLTSNDEQFLQRTGSDWELIHSGLHLDPSVQPRFFEVPDLAVGGNNLRASPDLIYRNRETGECIVVEIKFTWQAIPSNLWPNIWSQLWCYSKLPIFSVAPKITVVGEVWSDTMSVHPPVDRLRLLVSGDRVAADRTPQYDRREIKLRASVRRNPRLPAFDAFFGQLFDIYRRQKRASH